MIVSFFRLAILKCVFLYFHLRIPLSFLLFSLLPELSLIFEAQARNSEKSTDTRLQYLLRWLLICFVFIKKSSRMCGCETEIVIKYTFFDLSKKYFFLLKYFLARFPCYIKLIPFQAQLSPSASPYLSIRQRPQRATDANESGEKGKVVFIA